MFRYHTDLIRTPASRSKPADCEEKVSCDVCDAGWHSETDTFLHREGHLEEIKTWIQANHHVCLVCAKHLKTKEELTVHLKTAHLLSTPNAKRVERQIYICNDCSQIFFNKSILIMHIYKKHIHCGVPNTYMLKCVRCLKYYSIEKLWVHMVQSHNILSVATCKICFVKCKNLNQLQAHISTHPSYFSCDQCSMDFKDGRTFKSHIEQHENEGSKFKIKAGSYSVNKKIEQLKNWRYPKLRLFRGTNLEGHLSVCILCRHICLDGFEKRQHIASHFTVLKDKGKTKVDIQNVNLCSCGQTFTTNILKKHHLFTNKDHKMAEISVNVEEAVGPQSEQESSTRQTSEEIPNMDGLLERIFI